MAEDIKENVSQIDWVKSVSVRLNDHCASEEINKGISEGHRFKESFKGLSDGNLEDFAKNLSSQGFFGKTRTVC
jgi:hypothetical protein